MICILFSYLVIAGTKCLSAPICVPCILVYGHQVIRSVHVEAILNARARNMNGGRNPNSGNNDFSDRN